MTLLVLNRTARPVLKYNSTVPKRFSSKGEASYSFLKLTDPAIEISE